MLTAVPELDALDRLLDAAEALSGRELRTLEATGEAEDLTDTRVAQPLLYLTDWAWGATLLACGLKPIALAGHSLGELAALALAGVFSVEAGLELVVERSKLMAATAASTPGGMSAVLGMDATDVADAISSIDAVWIANDNGPGQIVISGSTSAIDAATDALVAAGARRVLPLAVAGPFHSPLMSPAADAFERLLRDTEFSQASVPVLQNTDPRPETDPGIIRERLVAQMVSPVRWTETMLALASEGPVTFVEAGPGAVLAGLARRVEGVAAFSVQDTDIESIIQEVS